MIRKQKTTCGPGAALKTGYLNDTHVGFWFLWSPDGVSNVCGALLDDQPAWGWEAENQMLWGWTPSLEM